VLGNNGQSETATHAVARGSTTGKSFEDSGALADSNARSIVVDDEQEIAFLITAEQDLRSTACVVSGVVKKIQKDSLDPATVDENKILVPQIRDHQHVSVPMAYCNSFDQRTKTHLLLVVLTGTRVESAQFEEVEHRAIESPNLVGDDLECLFVSVGELIGPSFQYLHGSAE
jgi:hypothetical protein